MDMTNAERLTKRIEDLGRRAYVAWGAQAEVIKAAEECSELSVVLCKVAGRSPVKLEDVVDEIADVLLMVIRLRDRYGPSRVDERIAFKLDRLEAALARAPATPPSTL